MRNTESFTSVFLHRDPIDMRKGLNGLLEIIQSSEMGALKSNSLFVFSGKRRDSVKAVYFDRTGFCLWIKRLEADTFKWPKKEETEVVILSAQQLSFLLEGYDLAMMKPMKHFKNIDFETII
jgi:transposase